MSRMYVVTFENVSLTTTADFFEITPADDKPVIIHAVYLAQTTEFQDAQDEMFRVTIIRGFTASGSGGTAATEEPLDPSNTVASGAAVETCNTTLANTGTTATLHADAFNKSVGWVYIPTPECRPIVNQGNTTLVVRLAGAPADSTNFSGTLVYEEI